jgi:glycosyltransferase involved in cell wall biosynthesis
MKILMASHYFASHKGGIEIVADELFREFAADGQEVVWIAGDATPAPDPSKKARAIPLRVFNLVEDKIGLAFPIPSLASLRRILSEVKAADVVILQDCLYLSNIVAFLIARFLRKPVLIIQHIGVVPYKSPVLNAVFRVGNAVVTRPMLSRASQVVFISHTTRSAFAGVKFKRHPEIIFNGVDTELFSVLRHETQESLRKKFGLPLDRPVALFVGRFVEKKGLPVLRLMASHCADYTWAFAGWGTLDPSCWNAPNVRVFCGLRGEAISELYRACDVLVLPSTGEGFPLVVQEALACGLPVVCGAETLTADPELRRFAQGIPVYPADDERTAAEFLAAVRIAIDSNSEQSARDRSAFASSRYSWRSAAERYLELLSGLCANAVSAIPADLPGAGNLPR